MGTTTENNYQENDAGELVSTGQSLPQQSPIRYHYLDNLRAIAMLAGVLFHAGLAYCVISEEVWPTADTQTSMIADYITGFMHTFRMPLFFLIAGFFAHYLVIKYGVKGFMKNRALRIFLPFVVFWPISVASIVGTLVYAATQTDVDTPIINLIRLGFENPEAAQGSQPPPSTTHLWFLYYLSMFCILTAVIKKALPALPQVKQIIAQPLTIIIVMPIISGLALSQTFLPHPAPESFIPQIWALVFYGGFF